MRASHLHLRHGREFRARLVKSSRPPYLMTIIIIFSSILLYFMGIVLHLLRCKCREWSALCTHTHKTIRYQEQTHSRQEDERYK